MFSGLTPSTVGALDGAPSGGGARRPWGFRRPSVTRGRLATVVVLTLIGGFLAIQVAREVHANFTITQRADDLRAEIHTVQLQNAELAEQLAYLRSDGYVSQEARRISNLGAADERVLIIPPGAEAALPPELRATPPPAPMLVRWLELFFGR